MRIAIVDDDRQSYERLLSTKPKESGLGAGSVQSIAERCHGLCRLEARDGMFYASVYCPLK